jgi:2-polyprenyl-3-methyl-5-hydroxy-6-metoxy-1,4-benzoquinol methylase
MQDPPELHWTPELVRRFWDHAARFPDQYFAYMNGREVVRRMARHLEGRETILDYGCGPGYLTRRLLERGLRTAGADDSPESVRMVAEHLSSFPNFLGAFRPEQLSQSGQRFDAVFALELVEHLYDDQLKAAFERLRSLLRPEGLLILTTPNRERLEDSQVLCPQCEVVFHRWQHVRSWSADSLRAFVESNGFEVVESIETNFGIASGTRRAFGAAIEDFLGLKRKRPHLAMVCRLTATGG